MPHLRCEGRVGGLGVHATRAHTHNTSALQRTSCPTTKASALSLPWAGWSKQQQREKQPHDERASCLGAQPFTLSALMSPECTNTLPPGKQQALMSALSIACTACRGGGARGLGPRRPTPRRPSLPPAQPTFRPDKHQRVAQALRLALPCLLHPRVHALQQRLGRGAHEPVGGAHALAARGDVRRCCYAPNRRAKAPLHQPRRQARRHPTEERSSSRRPAGAPRRAPRRRHFERRDHPTSTSTRAVCH